MNEKSAIQSALDAEQSATRAVAEAGRLAERIRKQALDRARQIESRAQARVARITQAVDAHIDTHRDSTQASGAAALRQLRVEAIDPDVMASAIDSLVQFILVDDQLEQRGEGT